MWWVPLCLALTLPSVPSTFFDEPVLIGLHRGGLLAFPENTAYAMEQAAKLGPHVLLEIDVRETADGHIVLLHDETVDRTTDGRGPVESMTLAEVQALDAAYRFRPGNRGDVFPLRGQGINIPTLQEALRAAPDHRFLIDVKDETSTAQVIAAIREVGAEQRVLIASFLPERINETRELAPELPVAYDTNTGARLMLALRLGNWDAYQPQAPIVTIMKEQVAELAITADEIQKIRAKGILFQIHTLNTEAEIRQWIEIGVDSILTDDPELLMRIVNEAKD